MKLLLTVLAFLVGALFATTSHAISTQTDTAVYQVAPNFPAGANLGKDEDSKISFHGATPTEQRASVSQAAVATTAATSSTPYGYSEAQANGIVTLLNEIRAALVEKGIIKGAQ